MSFDLSEGRRPTSLHLQLHTSLDARISVHYLVKLTCIDRIVVDSTRSDWDAVSEILLNSK